MYGASIYFAKLHSVFLRNSTRRNSTLRQSALFLDPKNDPHAVISFDVFDTLVRRPFADPDDAMRFLELKCRAPGWFAARKEAEAQALRSRETECVNLSQIYEFLPSRWRFMELEEIAFDLSILRPNQDAKALFEGFVASGKTVIIVSDTYYDSATIERFLEACGFRGHSRVFASSESGKTKSRGTLFDLVLAELGIAAPSQMLHIGDNERSDLHSPEGRGIHARKYPSVMESFRSHARFSQIEHYWQLRKKLPLPQRALRSYQVGILAAMHKEGYFEGLDLFAEMFAYAFPFLLLHFDAFLYATLQESGFKNLAFIARDGYLLKAVFDKRHNSKGGYNSRYLYASRFLIRALDLDIDSLERSDAVAIVHFLMDSHPEIAALLEGVSEEKLLAVFLERRPELEALIQRDRDLYLAYLESLGLRDEDVLCIDWGGIHFTAQRFLTPFFRNIKGVYCNVSRRTDLDIKSFIGTLLSSYELVEIYITAPEDPIYAVTKQFGKFAPVYGTAAEHAPFENILALMLRFLDDFDISAIAHDLLPMGDVMDIYRSILPALSGGECDKLSRHGNCALLAHAAGDYVNVWKRLRRRYRLLGRFIATIDSAISKSYRNSFHRSHRKRK